MQPRSKLADYSARLVEAGWLAVAMLLPLVFDPLASEVFEPVKAAALRWLACLMAAAMVLHAWERRPRPGLGEGLRHLRALPLAAPVLGVVVSVVLASVCSLQPELSFFGSLARAQGALTTLAGVVVFLALVLHLRDRRQWRRLVTAMLLASLPVAVYALVQRAGLDPLAWSQPVQQRAASSLGNPIFLAAYLAMVSFLALGRMLEAWRERRSRRVLGNGLLLALQLAAMLAAASRGPVLAWMAALGLFALLGVLERFRAQSTGNDAPIARGRRRAAWLGLPLLALGVALAVAGLARVTDLDQGSGRARVLIWQGAAQLFLPHAPLTLAQGDADPLHRWRPWLGYGPEVFPLVFHRVFPPELAYLDSRTGMPDRAHSETFDALVMTGLLGFIAWQALFLGAFRLGLVLLGQVPDRRAGMLCLISMVSGGTVLAALAVAWRGPALAGPAWPLGVAAGLFAYVLLSALARRRVALEPPAPPMSTAMIAACLCALLAHYLETGLSGIAVPATRSLAWLCLGMLVVQGLRIGSTDEGRVTAGGATAGASRSGMPLALLLLAGLAWAGLAFLAPLRADRAASQAARHAAEKDWAGAVAAQQQALALRPASDRYHAALADFLLQRVVASAADDRPADLTRAEAALRRARDLAPLHPVHAVNLARLYSYWAGQETLPALRRQRLVAADAAYRDATRLSPHKAEVWNEWAQLQMQRHRVALADGQPAVAATELGLARRYLGQSLELDGQYDRTFLVSAELAQLDGNMAAVAAAYQRALYHNPDLAEAWQGLAALHRSHPDLARLEATARHKLEAHPDLLPPLRILVSEVYLPAGRLGEAIDAQRRVLALCPEAPVRSYEQLSLALILAEAGKGREARELAQASLDGLPAERQAEARALIDLLAGW